MGMLLSAFNKSIIDSKDAKICKYNSRQFSKYTQIDTDGVLNYLNFKRNNQML